MHPLLSTISTTLLLLTTTTRAQYDQFFFATSANNYQCPGLPFKCQYPFACSHDSNVDKYYCCIPGSASNVCWIGSTACSGVNSTTAGSGQLDCGGFCCLSNREECTQRAGQINICWATAENPLGVVSDARMNATFSSLSAASPSASRLSFALAQVTGTSTSTSTSPSSTRSSSTGSATTNTGSASSAGSSSTATGSPSQISSGSSISGGAIAGIVIGALAGIGLIVAGVFLIRRRGRKRMAAPSQESYRQAGPGSGTGGEDVPVYQQSHGPVKPPMAEMAGSHEQGLREHYSEVESKPPGASHGWQRAHELPGN